MLLMPFQSHSVAQHLLVRAEQVIHDICSYPKDCSAMKYVYPGTALPLVFWDESSINLHSEDCWDSMKEK